ncbi:aminopeptidase N [Filimonas lacunae]|uniref:Aminopeptidase N n=1 Tax=Filimonas lacunae TaxID=477680 RepID=A0A173M9P9_9BACT|nr:M1 family aminopeptidase [Filimonas lacunae]BAV04267.1 aminopeptidase [Filimonas lacunae]SIT13308.1 aminopeptidase N [Filimonas lacunae]
MIKYVLTACALASFAAVAQEPAKKTRQEEPWKKQYRATALKTNDLVHTKLDVRFDYDKAYMYGKAWITLHPHFYTTDSLILDAKGMNINTVALVQNGTNKPLAYRYDSLELHIALDKQYTAADNYTVYIDYVSKPNELKAEGSAAITDAKGLYFINPKGEEKNKPTQIWTQGETEATSAWCPTIDHPNQKTTEEITMTVPDKYVTLSNGLLTAQKKNTDGTRSDTWKMTQPHAPYLFFMGVGDFAVIKDKYKDKDVWYYVEKEYAPTAKGIFGLTPEMMAFYGRITGIDYPWAKYSQMTGRDYVSGAMENTTATLHTDKLQQNARQLADGNKYEEYVAHELFHQWFGDLVTAESWSNLTVNESFANYSETMWKEFKYGKDEGAEQNYDDMQGYLHSGSDNKDLVRFYYRTHEDMFDAVSYNKGGRILHMLRHYIGDSAFFKSLNLYLTQNKFKSAETHQLRMAFEEITGQDLNWYFNQWYYGSGHPHLDISYNYNDTAKKATVYITQMQVSNKVFRMPVDIDIYNGTLKKRYTVWISNKADTFSFAVPAKPELINVDGDKILLALKEEHKTLAEYIYQYKYAGNYVDRREAVEYALEHMDENPKEAIAFIAQALNDSYAGIRNIVIKGLIGNPLDETLVPKVEKIAKSDVKRTNRAAAISLLSTLQRPTDEAFFLKATTDSSYSVAGAGLLALAEVNEAKAIAQLNFLKKDARDNLEDAVEKIEVFTLTDSHFDSMYQAFSSATMYEKFEQGFTFLAYLSKVEDTEHFKTGLNAVSAFSRQAAAFAPKYRTAILKDMQKLLKRKKAALTQTSNKQAVEAEIKLLEEKLK